MNDNAASFVGNIPEHYDHGLGPVFFTDFAEEMAKRVATFARGMCSRRAPAPASYPGDCATCHPQTQR